jgi:hypothetical protein
VQVGDGQPVDAPDVALVEVAAPVPLRARAPAGVRAVRRRRDRGGLPGRGSPDDLVRPVVFALTFPATLLTLGAWTLVAGVLVNAVLLWLANRAVRVDTNSPTASTAVSGTRSWGEVISLAGSLLGMVFNPGQIAQRTVR